MSDDEPAVCPVGGEIDLDSAPALELHLERWRAAHPTGDVVLDCSDLAFIDSSAIHLFFRLASELSDEGRRLVIRNLRGVARRAAEIVRLDAVAELR
jgi:anti-anti-sigma factor